MREPRSEFVRDVIEGLPWTEENRAYVEALLELERYALEGPSNVVDGWGYGAKRSRYEEEWEAIFGELAPGKLEEERARRERRAERWRELARERERRREEARVVWEDLGGRSP